MKVARSVSMCVLLLVPMTLLWAQDDPATRREERRQDRREERTRQAETTTAARDTTSDKVSQHVISEFATMLAIKNQEEIELCKWAAEKTQNDDVRQFAQKLIEDHTKMLSALQKFHPVMEFASLDSQETPTTTRTRETTRTTTRREERQNPGTPDRAQPKPDQPNPTPPKQGEREAGATRTEAQVTTRTAAAAPAGADQNIHLQVARETARRCLEITKEKLGSKEGQDFDRCFVGGAIVGHVGMIAKMQALQTVSSDEFSQLLEKGIQTAEEHLKHAELLAQKLEGGSGGATETARPRENRREPNEGAANRKPNRNPGENPNPNP